MEKVQVLLSSFNGARFIEQQLDSIFRQIDVEVFCTVRDDGSSDDTIQILLNYEKKNTNLDVIVGGNIGYGPSFFELLKHSGDYNYYAFSDQDDYWEPNKIINAITRINDEENNAPTMYCSNCTVVNSNLEKVRMLHSTNKIIPFTKETSLVQGFAHGCTMVFNKKSKDLVHMYSPQQNYAHDFWIPLIHVFVGNVVYDQNSYILYRQHNQNVFGRKRSIIKLIRIKISFFTHKKNYYSNIAKELLVGYSSLLTEIETKSLKDISEYKSSFRKFIKLLFNNNIRRNTIRGTIALKLSILLYKF